MHDGQKRCSCGQGCPTWGACMRRKGLHYVDAGQRSITSDWDGHLDRYEWAVRQGIQPDSTLREETEFAIALSNETGTPYRGDEI